MFYEAEGTSGRLNFNFLPFSISETVNAVTNVVPDRTLADNFSACRLARRLEAWAGIRCRSMRSAGRPAVELRVSARDRQPHEPRNELRRDKGRAISRRRRTSTSPAGPGNIQARRPYPRFGNMSIHSQARSSDTRRCRRSCRSGCRRVLVSRVAYLVADPPTQPAPGIGGNFTYEHRARGHWTSRTFSR